MKLLYLATEKIHSKWTRNYANWNLVLNKLNTIFDNILQQKAKKSHGVKSPQLKLFFMSLYIIALKYA